MLRTLLLLSTCLWAQSIQVVFVGAVTDTSAQALVWAQGTSTVQLWYGPSPDGANSQLLSISLSPEGFGKARLTNLSPYTRYYYQAFIPNVDSSGVQTFQTFPAPGQPAYFRFAFGSCQAFGYAPPASEPIFRRIALDTPLIFLQCGDWGYPDIRYNRLPHDSTTFAQWWDTIVASYYARYGGRDIQHLMAIAPIDYVYDDHDYLQDNASRTSSPYISDTLIREFSLPPYARRNIIHAYTQFFPHYPLPDTSEGIFHRIRIGNVEIFVCDNRSARDPDLNALRWQGDTLFFDPPPSHSMLGAVQRTWLLDGLRSSTATWKFVVTGVAFNRGYRQILQALSGNKALQACAIPGIGNGAMLLAGLTDTWAAYAAEQDSLLAFCQRHGIRNVIWLSSDSHTSAIDDGENAGFPELMAGNLRQTNSRLAWLMANAGPLMSTFCPQANLSQSFALWNAGGQGLGNTNFNDAYGRMEVFGEDSVRLSIVDTAGIVIASLTLPNSASSALPTVARRTTSSPIAISWDAAHENATIQLLAEVPTPATLLLTNLSGHIIASYPLTEGKAHQTLRIPMAHLPQGLYFVGLQAGPHTWTHHLIRP
jgi:hypothetical protein